jgi:diamine N-acetyltransferase
MNTKDINLVKLSVEDLEELQSIGSSTYYDTFAWGNTPENMQAYLNKAFSKEKLMTELEDTQAAFYFAKYQEETVGYIKINFERSQTELKEANGMELERIYVTKAYQGKHIGQLLLNKALDIALENKKDYIWLGVWTKNEKAIAFYQRNGFAVHSTHSFWMGDDEQEDFIMKKIF